MRPWWWLPVVLAVTGCRGSERLVRLDTGRGEPIVFTPRATADQRVKLDEREVRQALAQLGREVHPPANPQEAARQLFELGARSGWFQYDAQGRRLVPMGRGEVLEDEGFAAEKALTHDYLSWCERKGSLGDCMRLLMEGPLLTGDGRYALAMAFAKGAVLDEMKEAFKGMANSEAVLSAVLWTCTTYLLLLAVPEPLSKGIAAVLTAALIAWVGFDTFWSLIVGFKQMVEEADRAVTFDALRQAGARYGKVMGRNAARAFVMLATAAIGTTAAGLASRLPTLPGAAEAAMQARAQLGIGFSGIGAVTAVAVSASAATISLTSGTVVAMSESSEGGSSLPAKSKHAAERQREGRPVGSAPTDVTNARRADVFVQALDGRFIVRGPRGREHILAKDGTLITSLERSAAAHQIKVDSGQRRPVTEEEFNAFRALFGR